MRGDCVHHIGVGDVFVIAGQSNSAGYGKDYISDCLDAGVHLLKNNGKWDIASHPINDSTGTIHPQNRDGANTGHGMYLSFAKYLKRELGYPIGLVQASLGGSPLKAWSAEDGYLYRSMIHIVRGLNGIKGILWYQGCSDTSPEDSRTYEERFEKMVRDVRRTLNMDTLPFLTCQINRAMTRCDEETIRGWGRVREAQRRAAQKIQNVFIIPTWGGGRKLIPISAKVVDRNVVELKFQEELPRVCTLHGAYEADLPYPPVTDGGSRLPMLSFYEVEVEEKRVETGMS